MGFIIFTDLYTNIYLEVSCLRIKYMSKTFETYSHYIYTLSYAADVHSYIHIGRVYRACVCVDTPYAIIKTTYALYYYIIYDYTD